MIATEEHVVTRDVVEAWRTVDPQRRDLGFDDSTTGHAGAALLDWGEARIAAMDAAGVDVQVLSLTTPGVQNLEAAEAVRLQTQVNDLLAETIRAQPDRFQAFAALSTPTPDAAARELERAVTTLGMNGAMLFGRTGTRNMDDPSFWPIYEAAAALRVPLYLHPQSPVPAVRSALYDGLSEQVSQRFATSGIGWHYEAGVQAVRLILSGVLDRFPDLRLILGHWGEVVLFYLDRLELVGRAAKLPRSFAQYARDQLYVGPSGLFSHRYMRWAIELVGIDRILFSTDYPFAAGGAAVRAFLAEADLSDRDREQFASGNWERLTGGIRR